MMDGIYEPQIQRKWPIWRRAQHSVTLSLTGCATFIFSSIKWRWYSAAKCDELFRESRKKIYLKTFVNCKVFHMNKKLLSLLLLNLKKHLLGRTVPSSKYGLGLLWTFEPESDPLWTIVVSLKFGHNVCPR